MFEMVVAFKQLLPLHCGILIAQLPYTLSLLSSVITFHSTVYKYTHVENVSLSYTQVRGGLCHAL